MTPASAQVPANPSAPVIVNFVAHALRVALVARPNLRKLPSKDWDAPGVYILLGRLDGDPTQVYVGKATSLRRRLAQHHHRPRLDWWRAVLITRDTRDGFNSAEVGYLEGRLRRQLGALPAVSTVAGQQDTDETLPSHMLSDLDAFIPTILAALRIAGLDTALPDPEKGDSKGPKRASYSTTIADLVSAGLLRPGEKLLFDGRSRHAEATINSNGEIVLDGVSYESPSAAGKAVLDGRAVNGWKAWTVGADGPQLSALRDRLASGER